MDAPDRERRVALVVHTAFLVSVGLYGLLLGLLRSGIATPNARPVPPTWLFAVFSALGVAQFAGASLAGRRLLESPRGEPAQKVRTYFLIRAVAAEAISLYALLLGFLGAPLSQVLALFAISVAALLACAPGKEAWDEAVRKSVSSKQ